MRNECIPLAVGVTGHRAIRPQDRPALAAAVRRELEKLRTRYPNTPLMMLDSLAEGADQICAEAALDMGIPLVAVLPMAQEEYEKDFEGPALEHFRALLEKADQCLVAPPSENRPAAPNRDFLYRQAGIYVATHCHVLLALWDGGPGTPAACGASEAVGFALHRSYHPIYSSPLFSTAAVIHLFTPRGQRTDGVPGEAKMLWSDENDRDETCKKAWLELMDKTEEFNAMAAEVDTAGAYPLLPERKDADPLLDSIESVYQRADKLSLRYAKIYRRILVLLALVSTLITMCFLLYDEANMHGLIIVCGLALLSAWVLQKIAKRSSCHRRYLEYRVLAESLRAQGFLRYAGVRRETITLLPWSQQEETPWIGMAIIALCVGEAPARGHNILACWPEDQRNYHLKAKGKTDKKLQTNSRIVNVLLFVSIVLYAAALVFELRFGGLLARFTAIPSAESWRTGLKLVLGTISAVTLFLSSYFGKLSLSRGAEDHVKMAAFYQRIIDRLTLYGQDEPTLLLLAREELIENGNWCSYQWDNTPDFSM
jgi:hypothetical protein